MFWWIASNIAICTIVPTCTWIGGKLGSTIASGIWDKIVTKLSGYVKLSLKRSRTYIVYRGEVVEIDPDKKYVIELGRIFIDPPEDILDQWEMMPFDNSN